MNMKLSFKKKETTSSNDVNATQTKKSKFSKKQLGVISIIMVIVIAVGCFFAYNKLSSKKSLSGKEITVLASMGSVSSVIEGSGTLQALQQYEITSLKKGEVIEDFFEEGDIVNEGDILYRMDDEEGREAIDNAMSSLNKVQRNYNKAAEDISNLVVKAKSGGVVTQVYIEPGDNVNANAKVADLIDNSNMILEIQFLSEYASSISAGVSIANVTLSCDGTALTGKVTKVSSGEILNSLGARVTNVEITVPNPGAIKDGDYATAEVNGLSCSSEGTFKNSGKSTIFTEVAGEVKSVNIMKGDKIIAGQTVANLANDSITDISETRENLSEAQNKYNDTVESLEDYVVKAPITGTIIQKNIKAGEKLESTSASSAMAIIADLSAIVFEMSVDELDISKMEVGMAVEVQADAIENTTFSATVTGISIVGTSNNGVTSYPVKVTLNPKEQQSGAAMFNYDKLIPGLNVSATVVIERVENVIVVPVSAVRRGNIVIVSEDSKSQGINFGEKAGFRSENTKKDIPTNGSDGNFAPEGSNSSPVKPGGENRKMAQSDGNMRPSRAMTSDGGRLKNPNPETVPSGNNTQSSEKQKERLQAMIDSLDIPKGYKAIVVETGLSDESFIEIKNGLSEGDKVLLPDTTSSQNSNSMANGMPGGMGGFPGGMGGFAGGMGGNRGGMTGNRSGTTGNRSGMSGNRSSAR